MVTKIKKLFGLVLCYLAALSIDQFFEARGFVPGRWLSEAYDRMNTQIPEEVFSQAFIILAALLLYYSEIRFKWIEKILSRKKSIKVERDIWLFDAIYYVAFGTWDYKWSAGDEARQMNDLDHAIGKIQQKAFEDKLPIWGKPHKFFMVFRKIDPEFWEENKICHKSLLNDKDDELETINMLHVTTVKFISLKTSRAKILELWPKLDAEIKQTPKSDSKIRIVYRDTKEFHLKERTQAQKLYPSMIDESKWIKTFLVRVETDSSEEIINCKLNVEYIRDETESVEYDVQPLKQKSSTDEIFSLKNGDPKVLEVVSMDENKEEDMIEVHFVKNPISLKRGKYQLILTAVGANTMAARETFEVWVDDGGYLKFNKLKKAN